MYSSSISQRTMTQSKVLPLPALGSTGFGKNSLVTTTSSSDGHQSIHAEYNRYRCRHYRRGCDLVVSFITFWVHDTMLYTSKIHWCEYVSILLKMENGVMYSIRTRPFSDLS